MQGSRRTAHERTVRTRVTLDDGASYNSHLQKATNEVGKGFSTAYVRYDAKSDKFKLTADNPKRKFSFGVCVTTGTKPIGL